MYYLDLALLRSIYKNTQHGYSNDLSETFHNRTRRTINRHLAKLVRCGFLEYHGNTFCPHTFYSIPRIIRDEIFDIIRSLEMDFCDKPPGPNSYVPVQFLPVLQGEKSLPSLMKSKKSKKYTPKNSLLTIPKKNLSQKFLPVQVPRVKKSKKSKNSKKPKKPKKSTPKKFKIFKFQLDKIRFLSPSADIILTLYRRVYKDPSRPFGNSLPYDTPFNRSKRHLPRQIAVELYSGQHIPQQRTFRFFELLLSSMQYSLFDFIR